MHTKPEPKIAEAVGSLSLSPDPFRAKRIEQAMASAVQQALDEGISMDDSATMRARMLAARDAVKKQQTGA